MSSKKGIIIILIFVVLVGALYFIVLPKVQEIGDQAKIDRERLDKEYTEKKLEKQNEELTKCIAGVETLVSSLEEEGETPGLIKSIREANENACRAKYK